MKKMEQRFSLVKYGPRLWTREEARKARGELVSQLDQLNEGEILVIDAAGVDVFDYSFANEFFGNTMLSLPREFPGRLVVVEHLLKYARENLTRALEGMGLAMIERKGSSLALIGKVHPADEQTFSAIVHAREPVNAAELSKDLKVNLNAMNERLSKLAGLGLVRRERTASSAGREQYVYTVLR